ncbi:MAG: alpha-amylase [Bacteroidales bacterium]|nr:alpha-amylase [Bacteroidales bacterium]
MNIYQLFVRTFGNKNTAPLFDGDKSQNGCGTFANINDNALESLKALGITHIWLTGVIRHSSMTAYPELGIKSTHPQITKGKAGSPYSIMDYYDVDPDLAVNPQNRMEEFEETLNRIHEKGMKVIMDFIPNHLAREYKSLCKPYDVEEFGEYDNKNVSFAKDNNFYYCPNQEFVIPTANSQQPTANSQQQTASTVTELVEVPWLRQAQPPQYQEFPAKASGNDVFSPCPSVNDWYDAVKLNYGVDYQNNHTKHFDTIPNTWYKMLNIMQYWCEKGVDGFRVDMAEMVPVEFWYWSIHELRESHDAIMIAEIYQPHLYKEYVNAGFDYLYDKVGLYNTLENIYRYGQRADTITGVWNSLQGLGDVMLRFMENHDELRLASKHFVGNAFKALPAVAMSALMNRGPFMIYNGQESGEDAEGAVGFSGDDGRTSIFDYAVMPRHQKWMADGKFDGSDFTDEQRKLYNFYKKLLNFRLTSDAINKGAFYDLMWVNPWYSNFDPQNVYAFLRYYNQDRLLIVINFNQNESRYCEVKIAEDAIQYIGLQNLRNSETQKLGNLAVDAFTGEKIEYNIDEVSTRGIAMTLEPCGIKILKL